MHRVVIIGGGFGGLRAAQDLARAPVQVTLIDRRNYHLFQPLLYQVATGTLSPANIASPLRVLLKRQRNLAVLMAEVRGFDVARREVLLAPDAADSDSHGRELPGRGTIGFDTLIVAAGSGHSYFGHPEWELLAPSLKSLDDATEIRRRILWALEAAERSGDPVEVAKWLTFVAVGGGPTGVELVGQMAEIAAQLHHVFRSIEPAESQIYLIEANDRILPSLHPELSAKAERALTALGVRVLTSVRVTQIAPQSITVEEAGKTRPIATRTVLWAAGVQASPLGQKLALAAGVAADRSGRVPVGADLTIAGHPELFVIGDMALRDDASGNPLPALAPVAMQQGGYVARLIRARISGKRIAPFCYHDRGVLATIGRGSAVADLRFVRLSGPLAWLAWLFLHLLLLVQFRNRMLVFIQWGWSYLTRDRAALLITGKMPIGPAATDNAIADNATAGNAPAGNIAGDPQRTDEAGPQTAPLGKPVAKAADVLEETSEESFPASDPPAWNHSAISRRR